MAFADSNGDLERLTFGAVDRLLRLAGFCFDLISLGKALLCSVEFPRRSFVSFASLAEEMALDVSSIACSWFSFHASRPMRLRPRYASSHSRQCSTREVVFMNGARTRSPLSQDGASSISYSCETAHPNDNAPAQDTARFIMIPAAPRQTGGMA
jgi:hypothetical protein